MERFVGCSGYFYWHWKGVFYPPDLPPQRWFSHYARELNTVEINASFYRFPDEKRVRGWIKQAPPGFVYAVKAHRSLTHQRILEDMDGLSRFARIVQELGDHLGMVLFQLPPRFKFSPANLERVCTRLSPLPVPVAVEFRHASWWREETWDALGQAGIVGVTVVAPRLPADLVQTTDVVYLRFHGKSRWYRDFFEEEDLRPYAEALKARRPRKVFAYFNNDVGGHAPRNARTFREMLDQILGT